MPRKEKNYHFIYKTTNLVNGKYYYGMHSTDNLDDGYLGSGKYLQRSLKKYGKENFKKDIIEFCENREQLKMREIEIVNLNEIAKNECMNLKQGGYGGLQGIPEDSLKNIRKGASKWMSENNPMNKDENKIIHSELFKALHKNKKISYITFKGKHHTEKTKLQMKLTNKGKRDGENNSQFGTCWINKDNECKKINKNDLNSYLNNGWIKGRKIFN